MTLNYVDENRIGVLGICGGGGYALNVAMTEKRIKAVATVDAVNFGRLSREGFSNWNPLEIRDYCKTTYCRSSRRNKKSR